MLQRFLFITLTLCSLSASAQWQQTGSKVRYVNGLGIPTKDTAAGVAADSSQILIRPADSSLYIKYKRTWIRVGGGGGSIGGSGTTNYVPKFTASGFIGNSQIFDNGNVGINTTSPTRKLTIQDAANSYMNFNATSFSNYTIGSDLHGFIVFDGTAAAYRLAIKPSTGNVLVNTTTDNGVDKLQVSGSVTASGTLTAATIVKSGGTSSQFLMADGSTSLGGGGSLSGTTNYVPKFTSSSAIGNSQIIDNGTNVSLRTTASTYAVNITTGANSGIGLYEDGTQSTIIGQNQNITATNFLSLRGAGIDLVALGSTNATIKTNSNNRLQVLSSGRVLLGATLPTDNTVDALQVNGSISGIGMKQAYVAKTGAYTATNDDYVIDCTSGTFTVTLPASSGRTGRILIIKNSGAGTITVDGNSTETIDGATTVTMAVQYGTIQIMSDGTNWKTIAKF
jgi:hypothetical protein